MAYTRPIKNKHYMRNIQHTHTALWQRTRLGCAAVWVGGYELWNHTETEVCYIIIMLGYNKQPHDYRNYIHIQI